MLITRPALFCATCLGTAVSAGKAMVPACTLSPMAPAHVPLQSSLLLQLSDTNNHEH